jgi:hypothetical protein
MSFSLRLRLVVLALAALLTLPSLAHAAGMSIDPDGSLTSVTQPQASGDGDAGMSIDPNGAH